MERVIHPFLPVFNGNSKLLILGTMPSVVSREQNFYYSHPTNRFYKVLASLFGVEEPNTIEQKKQMLLHHGVAVFDVLKSCEIHASSDSTIKKPVANDLSVILEQAAIKTIFANGKKACQLYQKYCEEDTKMPCICLPSTSAANAQFGLHQLILAWTVILDSLS